MYTNFVPKLPQRFCAMYVLMARGRYGITQIWYAIIYRKSLSFFFSIFSHKTKVECVNKVYRKFGMHPMRRFRCMSDWFRHFSWKTVRFAFCVSLIPYKEAFLLLTDPHIFQIKGCLSTKCVLFWQIPRKLMFERKIQYSQCQMYGKNAKNGKTSKLWENVYFGPKCDFTLF